MTTWKSEAAAETVARLKHYLKLVHSWFPNIWSLTTMFLEKKAAGEVKKQPPNLTAGEFNRSE